VHVADGVAEEQTVATDESLEVQVVVEWLVRFCVTGPVENVPIAVNWLV
jgi:hypothetical protein